MLLTLNVDPPHVTDLKSHARQRGVRASCLVTGIIDGLSSEPRPPFLGQSIRRLRQHRAALVLQGLLNIAVFGPVARGEEQPGNDADLLVKVAGDMDAFRLAALQADLAEILGALVEIMTLPKLKAAFLTLQQRHSMPDGAAGADFDPF